ncbi:MAG: cytochrome P450 [Myxococcota bacterium]
MNDFSALPVLPTDDAGYWQDPYPHLAEAREQSRVAVNAEGLLQVLRWDDAVETMKGTRFIAEGIEVLERKGFNPGDPLHTWRKNAIGTMEGDQHRRVRGLAGAALSKRKMDGLRPMIRRHAHALLDEKMEEGALEARHDYAGPLPRRVMMEFLGIAPDEMMAAMGPMSRVNIVDCFGPNVTPQLRQDANESIQVSMDHTAMLFEKRRTEPKDDLLTALLEAGAQNEKLEEGELVTLFSTIFGSGASTTSIIASGLMEFARHPDQAAILRADPQNRMNGASEEVLRYRPGITGVGQKASTDLEAFGLELEAGTPLMVSIGSANRDPRNFENPETFDITRDPKNTSLSFGIGAHVCLGHAMARATVEEALAVFVERCDEIELANEPSWIPFVMENKLDGLSLRFRGLERTP